MDQKTVYIDEEIHQEAKEMAQAEGKKLNFFITELVREAIEARKPVDLGDPMGSELPENDQITFQEQQETD